MAVFLGTALNVFLSYLCHLLDLPLYLDVAGTIVVTALGGMFPGIVTGVLTNILLGVFNSTAIFYTFIAVLIAICTAWYVKNDRFKEKKYLILFVAELALIAGVLGMLFQWLLIGQPQFEDVFDAAEKIAGTNSGPSFIFSATIVNYGLNIVDKTLTCIIAFTILHFIPQKVKTDIWNSGWKQKPLTDNEIREYNNSKSKSNRMSLNTRMTVLLVFATFSISMIMVFIGMSLYYFNLKNGYVENCINGTEFALKTVDADKIEEYALSDKKISEYKDEGYLKTDELICSFVDNTSYIEKMGIYQIKKEGYKLVFTTDDELRENYALGAIIPFDEDDTVYAEGMLKEEDVGVIVDDKLLGYTFKAYQPVYNSSDHVVAYIVAEASMNFFSDYMMDFMMKVILVFIGFLVLIIGSGLWITNYDMIYPVKSMTAWTYNFVSNNDDQQALDENVKKLRELNIHTGDDIEDLYQAICKMALDMAEQMRDIRHYSEATAQMQNGLIITMADMVENRDSDTGAHIQKTAEYVRIILNGLKEKGYYTAKLTSKYMMDVEMSAPLHDVGKINIPDAVLNKPGKLNDEEYEIMKYHTTAGKIILEKAINYVQGGNYLKEARNMAAYHHERWDGNGYPEGLHGEVIPLSARIMAVADVFDALASERVYKTAYSLDETVKIIKEGAGTQFDPKVVEAFVDNMDEVERVLRKYKDI